MKIFFTILGCAMILALGCDKDESTAVDADPSDKELTIDFAN